MSRIDEKSFWADRLGAAQAISRDNEKTIHYSVFKVSHDYWLKIEESHERVISEYIDVENDSVLDIGCAFGRNYVKDMKDYVGIDLSPDFINVAKNRFPDKTFINIKMQDYSPDKKFDWGILSSIKRMIVRENGDKDWQDKEEHLKKICKRILVLEYTEAAEDKNYIATEIIEGY